MNSDSLKPTTKERIIVRKYEGDPTQEEIDNGTAVLLEEIVIENDPEGGRDAPNQVGREIKHQRLLEAWHDYFDA